MLRNLLAVSLVGLALVGCDRDAASTATPSGGNGAAAASNADALPAGLVLTAAPEGAKDVESAKKAATKDAEVVVRGVVAGSSDPIAENRAVFTLADVSLQTCDKEPGDSCKTPWDACCAEPGSIAAKSLTVQVVGPDGKPLKTGLKGAGGLAPLKHVTVKAKVRTVEGEGEKKVVTLDASGIHVKG